MLRAKPGCATSPWLWPRNRRRRASASLPFNPGWSRPICCARWRWCRDMSASSGSSAPSFASGRMRPQSRQKRRSGWHQRQPMARPACTSVSSRLARRSLACCANCAGWCSANLLAIHPSRSRLLHLYQRSLALPILSRFIKKRGVTCQLFLHGCDAAVPRSGDRCAWRARFGKEESLAAISTHL